MRKCRVCELEKPLEEFGFSNRQRRRHTCHACWRARRRAKYAKDSKYGVDYTPKTEKACTRCGIVKPADAFYKRSGRGALSGWNRMSRCKECIRDINLGRSRPGDPPARTREQVREANLRKLYKIGQTDYEAMLLAQGGACAVCAGPPMGKGNYHVDHCHATGRIRGLLCHKCNVALGMVQDSPAHLQALIAYLAQADHVNSVIRAPPSPDADCHTPRTCPTKPSGTSK